MRKLPRARRLVVEKQLLRTAIRPSCYSRGADRPGNDNGVMAGRRSS